jgi:F-type H+-transporting ATPase subunit b
MKLDLSTFLLQAVNAAVLIWLLKRFFWAPLSAMIARRRELAAAALAEAEAKRAAASAAAEEAAKVREGFAEERQAALAAARDEAAKERETLLAAAAAEAEGLRAAARQDIEAGRAATAAQWQAEATRLAVTIAGRLAERLDGAAVRQAFRDWLGQALRAVPPEQRPAAGSTVRLTAAAVLDEQEQARCRAVVAAALGDGVAVEFAVDPALIAGLELEGGGLTVRNSWRADLERIATEIGRER